MRKIERFKINDLEIEVKELTVSDMLTVYDMFKEDKEGLINREFLLSNFDKILPLATNLKKEQFVSLAPSEINEIWEKFKEVNAVFFSKIDWMIDKLQIETMWQQARDILKSFYLEILSGYFDKVLSDAKTGDTISS